jgi:Arc/MetJ family transcription regulator
MGYVRTNVVLDEELITRAMELWGFRTKRETIDFALRQLVGYDPAAILELEGIGWEGDLDEMRGHKARDS